MYTTHIPMRDAIIILSLSLSLSLHRWNIHFVRFVDPLVSPFFRKQQSTKFAITTCSCFVSFFPQPRTLLSIFSISFYTVRKYFRTTLPAGEKNPRPRRVPLPVARPFEIPDFAQQSSFTPILSYKYRTCLSYIITVIFTVTQLQRLKDTRGAMI